MGWSEGASSVSVADSFPPLSSPPNPLFPFPSPLSLHLPLHPPSLFPKMGIFMSRLFSSLFGGREVRILILGLDNAGKTTILYRLQNESDEAIQTIPTIGFNVETLQYKNIKFQVWDLGGQTSIRPYWRCYYPNTDAIIFVVDSADTERLAVARQELTAMLQEEEVRNGACEKLVM